MLIWSPLQIDGEHMGSGGEVRDSNFEWIRLEQELMGSEQKLIQIHYIALIDRSLDRCESCLTSEWNFRTVSYTGIDGAEEPD